MNLSLKMSEPKILKHSLLITMGEVFIEIKEGATNYS